jgi:hypothetical protein
MEHKYSLLIKVLDKLREEAPKSYKTYYPRTDQPEAIDKARSLAFIHLLLKVKFGIIEFLDRHKLITEGTNDGGLDAYFIDRDRKKLFLIQSKFRTTADNFAKKSMHADDLIKMEVARITRGEETDSNGNKFNDKVLAFQAELRLLRDIAKYEYIVLFLGNITKLNDEQIRKLIDNAQYEVYNYENSYSKLVFPLSCGTYYDPEEIVIRLALSEKENPRLKQVIYTDFGNYNVTVVFIPTFELAKVMDQYKNSILKYNPRNYLSLEKKSVNERIRNSIIDQDKNGFALLNNGITVLSTNIYFSDSSGEQNVGQLVLTKPQILNGGQTAFTLSKIYEEYKDKPNSPLVNKEVLVKVITPINVDGDIDFKFIELISNATNQQNEVSEADRRSNHKIQIALQEFIFEKYGYLYERKTGEFYDGIKTGVIDPNFVINRFDFIKAYIAYQGEPATGRRISENNAFQEDFFYKTLNDQNKYGDMFFAYLLFKYLSEKESKFKRKTDSVEKYGYSLMYGKWAVIASIGLLSLDVTKPIAELSELAHGLIEDRLTAWKEFDEFIVKKNDGTKYFDENTKNYELYYKVNLIDSDIKEYFLK